MAVHICSQCGHSEHIFIDLRCAEEQALALVRLDGTRDGDGTVLYDKGGFVVHLAPSPGK